MTDLNLTHKVQALSNELRAALTEIDRLRGQVRVATAQRSDVWFWDEKGENEPESLSCPVVMSADTLREILRQRDAAEIGAKFARGARYRRARDRLDELRSCWRMTAVTQETYVSRIADMLDVAADGEHGSPGTFFVHAMLLIPGTNGTSHEICAAPLTEAFAHRVVAEAEKILDRWEAQAARQAVTK